MEDKSELINILNAELGIQLRVQCSLDELKEELASHINYLIQQDFNKLIYLLYRVDINEQRLDLLLRENKETDAGRIISDLVVERQLQKIKSRKENKTEPPANKDEAW